jgi:hypothetical protein
MLDAIYTLVILAIGIAGIWAFVSLFNLYIPRRKLMKRIQPKGDQQPDMFRAAGLSISMRQYNITRYSVYAFLFGYVIYQYVITRQLPVVLAVAFIILLAITNPAIEKISLVPVLIRYANASRSRKLNEEVLRAFIQLKNLALLDTSLNAYEIMKKLLGHTRSLKPYLSDLMKDWHMPDKKDEALKRFDTAVGTSDAANFSKVLSKLDTTKPVELLEELVLYEQQIMETRQTARERQNGALGDAFFSLVTLLLMAVLLDFVFVVVFSNINLKF